MLNNLLKFYQQWRERRLRKWCVRMAVKSLKTDNAGTTWYSAKNIFDFVKGKMD